MKNLQEALKPYRQQIDRLDEEILHLISQRALIARKIGEIKGEAATYRPEREAEVLRNLAKKNKGPLEKQSILHIFREIMSACLGLERPLTVAYLGPAGTFTQEAVFKQFGQAVKTIATHSIEDSFHKVENGLADYLVAPCENSTEGSVGKTLDLLLCTPLFIQGEVNLPIHHQLLSKDSSLKTIKVIKAHPQAFAQCEGFLKKYLPRAQRIPESSNAEAAKIASTKKGVAAIASLLSAEKYGLNVLKQNIEDENTNTTRFLVLGKNKVEPTGKDKTSLIISTPNTSGAIHAILSPFSNYGISMTKLESRPIKNNLWEYVFFIDIQGHIKEEKVALAVQKIKNKTPFVKFLGSYPVSPL
ncbi:MAG: prephenate dehydratase [Haemophilus parainfluenzae]|jgi:chorismate mutase|nr:MAG: prephenate dehydratase [Haemophilus parainfluenzae]